MPATQTPGPTVQFDGATLSADAGHNDGSLVISAGQIEKDSANLVLTRNGAGDWSLNRTAAGAETYNSRFCIGFKRTGELFNAQLVGVTPSTLPAKGIKLIDFWAKYDIGVVDLTTHTMRFGKSVLNATGVALTQTDIVVATNITKTQGNNILATVAVPAIGQVYLTDDNTIIEIELVTVMANTGTYKLRAMGCHLHFNYT